MKVSYSIHFLDKQQQMATKRKHEDDSIAGRLTKRLKTDTIVEEQKLDEVWKNLNDQLGAIQYPAVTEEEVDQWEMKVKDVLQEYKRFDRLRYKFPPQLREYLKLAGKAFKDYTDHSPRKALLQDFYGGFIADFDRMLYLTKEGVQSTTSSGEHTETKKEGQRVYWFCIFGESEGCNILVNCDSQDEQNFGGIYCISSDDDGDQKIIKLAASLADFFNLLITSMKYEAFPGFSNFSRLAKWIKGELGHECEIDTFKDDSWKLIDATTRSKPIRELIEGEKGTVYVPLLIGTIDGSDNAAILVKDSYGELMLKICGTPEEDNTHVTYDQNKAVLFFVNMHTGLGYIGTLGDAKKYTEQNESTYPINAFIDYKALNDILGAKTDRVKIEQFYVKADTQQS